jgi:hypothetical protein
MHYLFIYPKSSLKDLFAAGHFYGEGFAAGIGKGKYHEDLPGLANHYSQQY